MVEKKSNNFWYILGGIIIVVLVIALVYMQIQNKQKQEEIQNQQKALGNSLCIQRCESSWNNEYISCKQQKEIYVSRGLENPPARDVVDCSGSNAMGEGCSCSCTCVYTETFEI